MVCISVDVIFGGASIHNRVLFLAGHIETESGKATVRIRMNDEVAELEPDADGLFESTLKLDNGGYYRYPADHIKQFIRRFSQRMVPRIPPQTPSSRLPYS